MDVPSDIGAARRERYGLDQLSGGGSSAKVATENLAHQLAFESKENGSCTWHSIDDKQGPIRDDWTGEGNPLASLAMTVKRRGSGRPNSGSAVIVSDPRAPTRYGRRSGVAEAEES